VYIPMFVPKAMLRVPQNLLRGGTAEQPHRFLLSHDAVLFWQVRDLPGTAVNGQRSPGRGCSVCSSAARSFVRVRVS
jgi:hypothetical protein